jgi:SSS family solute:Na+ symporter
MLLGALLTLGVSAVSSPSFGEDAARFAVDGD